MPIDKKWPWWVFSSLSRHFQKTCELDGLGYYVEGDEIKAQQTQDYLEFRMNGPVTTEISKGYFKLEMVVNILIVAKNQKSTIRPFHTYTGLVSSAFHKYIPCYKYGDGDGLLGCMLLKTMDKKDVDIAQIGQVSPDIKEMQAMVQGYYCMLLEND